MRISAWNIFSIFFIGAALIGFVGCSSTESTEAIKVDMNDPAVQEYEEIFLDNVNQLEQLMTKVDEWVDRLNKNQHDPESKIEILEFRKDAAELVEEWGGSPVIDGFESVDIRMMNALQQYEYALTYLIDTVYSVETNEEALIDANESKDESYEYLMSAKEAYEEATGYEFD